MNVPKPRKLSSGNYFIQMRLGGESVSVTAPTSKECIREASYIKAEYLAGKRVQTKEEPPKETITLTQAIDKYIDEKYNTLSPSTIRGYRAVQKHRFQEVMETPMDEIMLLNWQEIANKEALSCSAKYLDNAYSFLQTVVKYNTKQSLPDITLPAIKPANTSFLMPEEVLKFVDAVKDTKIAVPALLALSSMRISEITALDWKDIPPNPDFIRTNGAVVRDEVNGWAKKSTNKNETSTRNVPILIPELKEAIEKSRKPSGPVIGVKQDTLRQNVHRICKQEGITDVTIHGLRHSFASLAYHLGLPEKVTQEIGGWKDSGTMHRIYTHIAQQDITRYKGVLSDFYERKKKESANKNANKAKSTWN